MAESDLFAGPTIPRQRLTLPDTAVPLHILGLRKLAGEIFQQVYSQRNSHLDQADKDNKVHNLHQKLIDWRRSMPFPLPESRNMPVPQLTTAWYDLNYHNHLIMLYRPSPLCPVITIEKINILLDAAAMSLRHVDIMRNNRSYAFNWLNLFSLFTTTLALIYAITAQPQPLPAFLIQSNSLEDLRLAAELLGAFGQKFPAAVKYHTMVQDVIARLKAHLPSGHSLVQQHSIPPTSYATRGTRRSQYDSVTINVEGVSDHDIVDAPLMERLPMEFSLSGTQGFFDDFAAQDMTAGFDLMGTMGDEDQFWNVIAGIATHESLENDIHSPQQ